MRRAPDFRSTVRRGARAGGEHLVVHLLVPTARAGEPDGADDVASPDGVDTVVGLIVPRSVGDAVRRTLVKRRLRHVMAQRVGALPPGSAVVVRAAAGAAQAPSAVLAAEVDVALARCLRPRRRRTPRPAPAPRTAGLAAVPVLPGAPR